MLASLFFYAQWSFAHTALLLFTVGMNRYFARKLEAESSQWLFGFAVVLNLFPLLYFKYGEMVLNGTHSLLLPPAISFYTFQSMSYTIDVYRKKIPHEKSFLDFALYVSFFPQLVAGPIVFARDFLKQLKTPPKYDVDNLYRGVMLILFGYFLKSVIADNLSNAVDQFFLNPSLFSSYEALYYCYCYAFQIFGDFAGYSYIAIGIALILGFVFPKNFDYPYLSISITDFWRRWHISLSTWLKEYLYFSLGGNKFGVLKTYRNLMITMLLGGLWHGASWNFVIWGGIHGSMLAIEKFLLSAFPAFFESKNKFLLFLRWFITFHLVILAWIFFRSSSLDKVLKMVDFFVGNIWTGVPFETIIVLRGTKRYKRKPKNIKTNTNKTLFRYMKYSIIKSTIKLTKTIFLKAFKLLCSGLRSA